jgi:hypothetical protein
MCCILCEEPVRSITFGLAAVGVVAIVNGTRMLLARAVEPQSATAADERAVRMTAGEVAP